MWPYDHGMLRPMSADRGDIVADCMVEMLAEGGYPAVTLRRLADRIGVTPSGVLRWFGSNERMWVIVAARLGWRWIAHVGDQTRFRWPAPLRPADCTDDVHGYLPGTDDEVVWTRVWLALVEVGRHIEGVGVTIDEVDARECTLIARMLGPGSDPVAVDSIIAVVRGLRHAICSSERPMPVRAAHVVLARQLRA